MFALVDCNNFYVSCERLFRPDLYNRPVIVLSNNDGCAVARSNEAKALGIKMGEPYFKIKALCNQHNIAVFSSNYALYGDISARVMNVIADNWPEIEIYSIDEAFLDLSTLSPAEHTRFCEDLQQTILKHTGIPTSIGIGQSKTLAKVANHIAKKKLKIPVFNITGHHRWLDNIPINEVWGVGRKYVVKLAAMQIKTAGDLARANKSNLRQRFNVVLQRTAFELQGMSCLNLEEIEPKKSIISSRSFGEMQTDISSLERAISSHVNRAWEKMRRQNLVVSYVSIFVSSNRFRKDLKQYNNTMGFQLIRPTDDLRHLTQFAKSCLKKIYKAGINYKKVGVLLDGLQSKSIHQGDLFNPPEDSATEDAELLMKTIENINHRFGKSTLRLASEGFAKPWAMKKDLISPAYTTCWQDIPVVKAHNKTMRNY